MPKNTIRIRIFVGVDAFGQWHACGWPNANRADLKEPAEATLNPPILWCWVEADVPLPEPQYFSVEGKTVLD